MALPLVTLTEKLLGQIAGSLVFAVVGALFLYLSVPELKPAYRILQEDPRPVRELTARDERVEVRGTVKPLDGQTVEAPFSGIECLACEFEAQEYQSNGQHGGNWKTLDSGSRGVPFLLEDSTGRVEVDPRGASLEFDQEAKKITSGESPPPRIEQFIQQSEEMERQNNTIDLVVTELDYGKNQRFVEYRLHPGETAHIYGATRPASGEEWGTGRASVTVTDTGQNDRYTITDGNEKTTAWHVGKRGVAYGLAGLGLLGAGLFFLFDAVLLLQ